MRCRRQQHARMRVTMSRAAAAKIDRSHLLQRQRVSQNKVDVDVRRPIAKKPEQLERRAEVEPSGRRHSRVTIDELVITPTVDATA